MTLLSKRTLESWGMKSKWKEWSLSDLIEIKHGFAFEGRYIRDEPPGEVLLTPGNFAIGGGFKADKFKYYDGPIPHEYVLQPGTLLVTMTDLSKHSDTLGFPAVLPSRSDGRLYLHNQRLGRVEIKMNAPLDKGFLQYLLCTRDFRLEVLASATGTTVKHTSPERIGRFRFLLPSLSEQRVIAHVLNAFDDKIRLNHQVSATLHEVARSLFKAWFVDFEPVRARLEGREIGLTNGIAGLFPGDFRGSNLGEIPSNWRASSLKDIADLNPESWSKATRPTVLDYVDLTRTKWGRIESTTRYDRNLAPSRAQRVLRPGDTIVGTVRPGNGSYALISEEGLTGSTGFAVLRPKSREATEFVYLASTRRENIEALARLADGGAYPAVRPEVVAKTPCVQPTESVLRAFSECTRPMFARIAQGERESHTLTSLRDALLPKLISGELRIKDAERLVSEVV